MEIQLKGNTKILWIAFWGLLMVFTSLSVYIFDPLQAVVDKVVTIKNGSYSYNLWLNPPYDVYLKVYVFNVTNYEEFIAGTEKLRFEEVGPYVYQEFLTHTNSVFHENGSLSYTPSRRVEFIRNMSVGDPTEDIVYVPNVPFLGLASMLHQSSMFLNLLAVSLTKGFNVKPILNITAYDYFWGYEDNLVHVVSSVLPNWITFQKFGILDRMYDEGDNTVTINVDPTRKTGSPLIDEQERGRLYSIEKWNGYSGLSQWGYQLPKSNNEIVDSNTKCNMLEGAYDGTIFPPNLKEDMVFRLYRKFFCRTMPIEYGEKSVKDGFDAFRYKVKDNFLQRREDNADNECYCKDKSYCLPEGLGDATPCYYGFPAAVSRPHLMGVDPEYVSKIDGMHPNEEKHGTSVFINPRVGLLISGYSRMQVNLFVWQTKYNAKTAPFNNMVLPLFWSEYTVLNLPPQVHFLMTLALKVGPVVQTGAIFLFAIVGTGLIATAGILAFMTIGVTPSSNPNNLRSPSFNIGYQAIRIIPMIRKDSWLSEVR